MSQVTHDRYMATLRQRFDELLRHWLASLPRSGWRGTAADLAPALEAIDAEHKVYTYVGGSSGLSKRLAAAEPAINAAGWALAFRRSNGRRLIEFTKAPRGKRA